MKKLLLIDRDGTIIKEPPEDYQVDSLEKLEFIPGVISAIKTLYNSHEYELVMITNQDGLGTDSFPEETFWPAQNLMMKTLEGEGIKFTDVLIDRTFPEENAPTRKPGTALLSKYMNGNYNFTESIVIGDRLSDVQLAKNLNAKAILLNNKVEKATIQSEFNNVLMLQTENWIEITDAILFQPRIVEYNRNTNETQISVAVNLDEYRKADIVTGIGFLDHMLDLFANHAGIFLRVNAKGDLQIDEHHTIEDIALTLGEAINKAIGSKRGMQRYGFLLPMDESLAQLAIDFSGRFYLDWDVVFTSEYVGEFPTQMAKHFFYSLASTLKCNLHIKVSGENDHHKLEAIFKALGRSIKQAIYREKSNSVPSTKGVL